MRSKYTPLDISDKDVLVNCKDYKVVYSDLVRQLPTNLLLNPMKERKEVEVEVCPGMSSLIRMVTTESDFVREKGTRFIAYQNAALDDGGGGRD